jgi:hypothetical protein
MKHLNFLTTQINLMWNLPHTKNDEWRCVV